MKRSNPLSHAPGESQNPPRKHKPDTDSGIIQNNGYTGFSFQTSSSAPEIQVVNSDINAKEFFTRFVAPRKPCILSGLPHRSPKKNNNGPLCITCQDLVNLAGDKNVQVEKRYTENESFGQNRTPSRQIVMEVKEFVERLRGKDAHLLYLSTQQQQSCNDDSGTTLPFQVPCEQLLQAGKIDKTLTWAGNLRLASCNLWMGCCSPGKQGSSSGLHHDFHDNFYLLLQGRKQFRLYSPDTAPQMEMFGEIDQIHFNGVISYKGNETRADGVPLEMMDKKHDDDDDDDDDDDSEEEDEEEEQLPFGRGFDYKSTDDEADFDENAEDDYDDIVGEGDSSDKEHDDEEKEEDEKDEELPFGKGFDYKSSDDEAGFDENAEDDFDKIVGEGSDSDEEEARPNSFSRIDPATATVDEFPAFAKCREYTVNLKAGQSLYIPAGWFHNVTSFSSEEKDDSIHTAINYWYHPPDELENFAKPYLHDPIDQKS